MTVPPQHLVCQLDGVQCASLEEVHARIKRFKVKRSDYYEQYYPRRDKYDGKTVIHFKDYEQYFSTDFATKDNLRKWLSINRTEGKQWALDFLSRRKADKGLTYAPSQAELRSLFCPSMPYYDAMFDGGYYAACERLGFTRRYTNSPISFVPIAPSAPIICDTREQRPLTFSRKTLTQKLDVGDYGLAGEHDRGVYIDRKSINDFTGTLSTGNFDRFTRELDRAVAKDRYVVMAVEVSIDDALRFDELPEMRFPIKPRKGDTPPDYTPRKASPAYIFHAMRELLTRYPLNFQIVFVNGRTEMSRVVLRVLELGNQVRRTDLQYLYERGKL